MSKPLAKSLHTISVLVRVAELIASQTGGSDPESLIRGAMETLGFADMSDPYDLRGKAVAALAKAQAKGGAA